MDTKKIMNNFKKKKEIIKSLAYHIVVTTTYFSEDFDIEKECEKIICFSINNMMDKNMSIIDIENKIISISNNTVFKNNYPYDYYIDYIKS